MKINKVAIVGMGALGILFGNYIREKIGKESVVFILNKSRMKKYDKYGVTCNGEKCDFKVVNEEKKDENIDLLIMAVKGTSLEEGIKTSRNYVGKNTIIISLLNGISSEEVLSKEFGCEKVVYCVAQGMDAVKIDNKLTFSHFGELRIGIPKDEKYNIENLNSLCDFFELIDFPYVREEDIMHRIWSKFMLNVGINQTVMLYKGTYGTVQKPGKAREMMIKAMEEVITLAHYEKVNLTEEDLNEYLNLVDTMDAEGMPSMRQDGLARRYSEVDLFSGTVLRLAKKYNLKFDINQFLYDRIKKIESTYGR